MVPSRVLPVIRARLLTSSGGEGTPAYIGEKLYVTGPGVFEFVVPLGVRRIHACAVGAGGLLSGANDYDGTGGGSLAWANNIVVEPGEKIAVRTGEPTGGSFNADIAASGLYRIERDDEGEPVLNDDDEPTYIKIMEAGGSIGIDGGERSFGDYEYGEGGGGNGGRGTSRTFGANTAYGSGGGAGGYDGDGGNEGSEAAAGSGGGSGGTRFFKNNGVIVGMQNGAAGGGVGVRGRGANGPAPSPQLDGQAAKPGKAGSGGDGKKDPDTGALENEENFGGGGCNVTAGGHGAVRIIWGINYSYPDNADIEAVE